MGSPQPELFNRERLIQLQDRIRSFVQQQCQLQRNEFQRVWSKPVSVRVGKGGCITDLRFERLQNGILRLRCSANDSDIREGDRVRISNGNPNEVLAEGEFYREEFDFIEIRLEDGWKDSDPGPVLTLDRSYVDLEDQFIRSVDRLGETEIGRTRILPLLAGEREPVQDFEESEEIHQSSLERGLNDSQAEAIAEASSTDLCFLIQGPPGTGKTHVLGEVVRNRWAKGERILISSFTHRAIHNALNKVRALCPAGTDICKIGRPVYDPGLKVDQFEYFGQAPFAQSGEPYVVGATPFTAQSRRLGNAEFDTVIFDEAGQIALPLAVMGMLSGRTYIFVGDDKQLPPVLPQSLKEQEEGKSIFHFLKGRGFEQMLNLTYRMNKEITSWPSEQFYWGDLTSHESATDRRIHYSREGLAHIQILDPNDPVVFVEMPEGEDKSQSHEEAILVGELLHELVKVRQLSCTEIGVVVPFRKQARAIRQRLLEKGRPDPAYADLVVDTIERMQGQERELVIVSMTASDPLYIEQVSHFLFQPNRLNVCFTRPRTKLIVLGSKSLLQAHGGSFEDEDVKEGRGLFQTFVANAKHIMLT